MPKKKCRNHETLQAIADDAWEIYSLFDHQLAKIKSGLVELKSAIGIETNAWLEDKIQQLIDIADEGEG